MMNWERLGRVFVADGHADWRQSHAYVPVPYRYDREVIRVFCSFLDENRIGRLGYVDVEADDPREIRGISERPLLDIGPPGAFDEHGVTPSHVFEHAGTIYLYYIGWQRPEQVRYTLLTGLARSDNGGEKFVRVWEAPLLPSTNGEEYFRTAPFLFYSEAGFRIYYIGGDDWVTIEGKAVPTYDLRMVEVEDPTERVPSPGSVLMRPESPEEIGFGKPWVLHEGGRYRLWYSIRDVENRYRLGYAESDDGSRWTRLDERMRFVGRPAAWEDEQKCFPAIIDVGAERYLFYNGNGMGRTGFGVAREVSP